jgi:hypothetical protein
MPSNKSLRYRFRGFTGREMAYPFPHQMLVTAGKTILQSFRRGRLVTGIGPSLYHQGGSGLRVSHWIRAKPTGSVRTAAPPIAGFGRPLFIQNPRHQFPIRRRKINLQQPGYQRRDIRDTKLLNLSSLLNTGPGADKTCIHFR